jgi:membrane-associated phospholipid phosphatase
MQPAHSRDHLPLLAAACIAAALLFARISGEVLQGEHARFDWAVRGFAMSHQYGWLQMFFRVVTTLASKEILVPLAMLIGWFLSRRDKVVLVLLLFCGFVAAEFVDFLKEEFQVGRPLAGMRFSRSFSFPSGHSSGAATIVALLSYVAWRQDRARVVVLSVSIAFALLVAASRVYLDRHWTTDVVAGLVIGAALGLACCAVYAMVERRRQLARAPSEG